MYSPGRWITLVCVLLCSLFTHAQRLTFSEHVRIEIAGPDNRVYLAKFNSDGSKLLLLTAKSTGVWSTQSGKLLADLGEAWPLDYSGVSWQPGGSRILRYPTSLYSQKKTAEIWDAETGRKIATLDEKKRVMWAEWSQSGDRVLTVGGFRGSGSFPSEFSFSIRDDAGRIIRSESLPYDIHSIRFFGKGKKLLISSKPVRGQKPILVYDAETGRLDRSFDHDLVNVSPLTYAKFSGESPDGKYLCGEIDLSKGITCWRSDDDSKTAYSFLDTKETGDSHLVGFSADSKSVAILRSRQKRIEFADTSTGTVRFAAESKNKLTRFAYTTIAGQSYTEGQGYGELWSPTGRYFILTDVEKDVTIWDLTDRKMVSRRSAIWASDYDWFVGTLPTDSESFSFNSRNELLLSVSARTAKVWNPENGQLVHEVVDSEKARSRGTFQKNIAAWSRSGKYLLTVANQNKSLILWTVND